MKSIKNIYKVGYGPSSSHTMGPQLASKYIKEKYPDKEYTVILYGSLALTGVGHLTDVVIKKTLPNATIVFNKKETNLKHPNTMEFIIKENGQTIDDIFMYSVGGGNIESDILPKNKNEDTYPFKNLKDVMEYSETHQLTIPEIVDQFEDLDSFLEKIFAVMLNAIERGEQASDILPGGLNVKRRAKDIYQNYLENNLYTHAYIYAGALAVSEENASASGLIVTAPTCGSSGILPAVLNYSYNLLKIDKKRIIDSLKVAGLIGEVVRSNASISGAEVGCQGEIGVACSMAAAAYCYLLGGNTNQIEYAAEIALEHHLGLTCDPVKGLVQIPCIERNALASTKAINAAEYAMLTDGHHIISFDEVVKTMKETGKDMSLAYKETSLKGLAKVK